jgi:ankyrin repeat protein
MTISILNALLLLTFLLSVVAADMAPEAQLLMACMSDSQSDQESLKQVQNALSLGANINIVDKTSGQTPLMAAIMRDKHEVTKFLLQKGADVTIAENDGYTPAHGAAFQGNLELLKILQNEHKVDILSEEHEDGYLPFHRACWGSTREHSSVVEFFLNSGIDPDLEAKNGARCIEMTDSAYTEHILLSFGASHARYEDGDDDDDDDDDEDEDNEDDELEEEL